MGVVGSDPPGGRRGGVVVMVVARKLRVLLMIELMEVSLALIFLAVLTKVVLVLGLLEEGRLYDS